MHCPYRHLVCTRVAFELCDTVYALAKAGGFTRSHFVCCLVIPGNAMHFCRRPGASTTRIVKALMIKVKVME